MADPNAYYDQNQELYRQHFAQALPWEAYLASSEPTHRTRWEQALAHTHLSAADAALLATFVRKVHLLVLSGAWCGDCVRQGPIFYRIAEAAPTIDLRFIDRDAYPQLADLLRINGARKVPVAVYLSEDFFEVGRFGDRLLSVYRRKARRELGPACETGILPPDGEELAEETHEWVEVTERMHLILRTSPLLRERYGD